ncbi:MAG: hypothetical protein JNM79_02050 [Burkholderiales bacterium]|nr:hypothetical protein [Burkholderiales bacterium]
MRTLITLDYELYFGPQSGTIERCLVEPTEALARVAARTGARFVFFVDAGFLYRLEQQAPTSAEVGRQFDRVRQQLHELVSAGHDVQLHIHPHWEDSHWDGQRWAMDTRRYRLHQFSAADIAAILRNYRVALADAAQYDRICAYRAGGWAMQPFEPLATVLAENGVRIDSSVMPGAYLDDPLLGYDFRASPHEASWRFSADPLRPDPAGAFFEVPISSIVAPQSVKISSAVSKRLGPSSHAPYGDGDTVHVSGLGKLRRLLDRSPSSVTIDGYKAVLLERAYREHARRKDSTFVVIGHPKAVTPFALDCLEDFLRKTKASTAVFPDMLRELAPA